MEILFFIYSFQYVLIQLFFLKNFYKKEIKHNVKNDEGISVLIPSYDEVLTINECLDSIINAKRDFDLEIIVIDDGKGSDTLNCLKEKYQFSKIDIYKKIICDESVRDIYLTKKDLNIYVIDKDNGGKSNALNVAIKMCHYNYFVCIDADTIIDKYSLIYAHDLLDDDVIALGGNVVPIINDGSSSWEKALFFYQRWEYYRNFSYSRIAFDKAGCVPLLSGAFSLFRKNVVIEMGGYSNNTLGEDFDLTLKMHEYALKNGGKIIYSENIKVYTQVPFDIKSLFKQRLRWQIGMLEVLKLHTNSFREFKLLASILKLFYIYESCSLFVEIIALLVFKKFYFLITLMILFAATMSLYILKTKKKTEGKLYIIPFMVLQILFHIMYVFVRLIAVIKFYLFKKKNSWGKVQRKKICY